MVVCRYAMSNPRGEAEWESPVFRQVRDCDPMMMRLNRQFWLKAAMVGACFAGLGAGAVPVLGYDAGKIDGKPG